MADATNAHAADPAPAGGPCTCLIYVSGVCRSGDGGPPVPFLEEALVELGPSADACRWQAVGFALELVRARLPHCQILDWRATEARPDFVKAAAAFLGMLPAPAPQPVAAPAGTTHPPAGADDAGDSF